MTYATQDDLFRLGLPEGALRGVSPATIEEALEAASRLADSYLRARYALPLSSWDESLTRAVAAIAAYDLMAVRGYDPARGADEVLRLRYEDAIRWLERVAAGGVSPEVRDSSIDVGREAFAAVTNLRRWP
jgi:phage gp36-like protein